MCGIDIAIVTAHSARSASTLTTNNMGLSIKDLQKVAGLSEDSTFRNSYNLPVLKIFRPEIVNRFKNNWRRWTYVESLFISVYYIF